MITGSLNVGILLNKFGRIPLQLNEAAKLEIRKAARLFITNTTDGGMLGNTPPANARARGPAARLQGQSAIRRDLLGGGNKSGSARFAGIFTVLPDSLIAQALSNYSGASDNVRLFVSKSGDVYGTERELFNPYASVEAMYDHHRRYWRHGRMTQAGGRTRDIGRWKFIDKMVVSQGSMDAYLAYVYEKVGITASSFVAAAHELGAAIPPWVERHGSRDGFIRIQEGSNRYEIEMGSTLPWATAIGMQRRMDKVLEYRRNALIRSAPYVARAIVKKCLTAGSVLT